MTKIFFCMNCDKSVPIEHECPDFNKGAKMENPIYLGDGVYAEWNKNHDGGIRLMANDHINPTDNIYLEPSVIVKFGNWLSQIKSHTSKIRKENENSNS